MMRFIARVCVIVLFINEICGNEEIRHNTIHLTQSISDAAAPKTHTTAEHATVIHQQSLSYVVVLKGSSVKNAAFSTDIYSVNVDALSSTKQNDEILHKANFILTSVSKDAASAKQQLQHQPFQITDAYDVFAAFQAFTVTFATAAYAAAIVARLQSHAAVRQVESVQQFTAAGFVVHHDYTDADAERQFGQKARDFVFAYRDSPFPVIVQYNAPWNLCRLCHHMRMQHNNYHFNYTVGSDVNVYILDSGIDISHPEFEGRASNGVSLTRDGLNDGLGHGTHVAGIVGSRSYGVNKNVNLISVKILDNYGVGDSNTLLAGINWVAKNHDPSKKCVVNMSISGAFSNAVNRAINALEMGNCIAVVAAGNNGQNSCAYSPSSASNVLNVAAIDSHDRRLVFPSSNFGMCVKILAPGYVIKSTYIGGGGATAYMSGTSMAAPHVSGAVSDLWSGSQFTPRQIRQIMYRRATTIAGIGFTPDTPRVLVYVGV